MKIIMKKSEMRSVVIALIVIIFITGLVFYQFGFYDAVYQIEQEIVMEGLCNATL